jgi:hypothetical protein
LGLKIIAANVEALAMWRNLKNYRCVAITFFSTAKLQKMIRIPNDEELFVCRYNANASLTTYSYRATINNYLFS